MYVGCADEQHLAQVEGHIQVVVGERAILFRVQHLQQRRCWGRRASRWPILSISSSSTTGSDVPARRSSWMMRPGIEPM
jgi:hypothetical protein